MREIKFRAKVKEEGMEEIWEEGSILHITSIYKGEEDEQNCDIYQIVDEEGVGVYVDKETIGQYTGLKDKNGKEIYEGDIVKITHRGEIDIGKIIYEYNGFTVDVMNMNKNYGRIKLEMLERFIEVIGNIYDNKELLEG